MSARLALVPSALRRAFADRLLVGHARRMRDELEPVLAFELLDRNLEMDLALPGERDLVQLCTLFYMDRRIFLAQFLDGGGELHLVLAVGGADRQAIDGRQF